MPVCPLMLQPRLSERRPQKEDKKLGPREEQEQTLFKDLLRIEEQRKDYSNEIEDLSLTKFIETSFHICLQKKHPTADKSFRHSIIPSLQFLFWGGIPILSPPPNPNNSHRSMTCFAAG